MVRGSISPASAFFSTSRPPEGMEKGLWQNSSWPHFLPDLVQGEVHDPAEFIALRVHVALGTGRRPACTHARRQVFRSWCAACRRHRPHQACRFPGPELAFTWLPLPGRRRELGDAAHNLAPCHPRGTSRAFCPGLDLHVGAQLVNRLAGQPCKPDDRHGLDECCPQRGQSRSRASTLGGVLHPSGRCAGRACPSRNSSMASR